MLQKGKNVLFNVNVYYTKIAKPALKYGKKPVAGKPHANREYAVDVLVTEEDYKLLKGKYKTVKAIKEAKEFTAAEFEEQFKVAPPYEADNYIVIKFKKSADYQDGNATPKPSVVGKKGSGINSSTEIGNGTEAHVQWREREWTYEGKKGLSLDLAALAVVNLVEYTGGGVPLEFGSDFEEAESSDFGDGFDEADDAPFSTDESDDSGDSDSSDDAGSSGDDGW